MQALACGWTKHFKNNITILLGPFRCRIQRALTELVMNHEAENRNFAKRKRFRDQQKKIKSNSIGKRLRW